LWGFGGLLAARLAVAWLRFTAGPAQDYEDQIVRFQGAPEDIEKVVWKTEEDQTIIEQRADDYGNYLWVTNTRYEAPPEDEKGLLPKPPQQEEGDGEEDPPEESSPDGEEDAPERIEDVRVFKGSENGDKLLESLSPMLAIRLLDDVDDSKLESIGLAEPKGEMQLIRKGRTATLEIGGEAVGTRDMYMRNTADGKIYLIDDQTIRSLKYARTRLPNRAITGFQKADVVKATLSLPDGASLEVTQENPLDPENARWARIATPDVEDARLETWMGKAIALKGTNYANPETPPEGLIPQFSLTLEDTKGTTETLEVLREGEDGEWWGRSPFTRGLIQLLKGPSRALVDDASAVINDGPVAPDPEQREAGKQLQERKPVYPEER